MPIVPPSPRRTATAKIGISVGLRLPFPEVVVGEHVHRDRRRAVVGKRIDRDRRLIGDEHAHRRGRRAALAVGDGVREHVRRRRGAAVRRVGDRAVVVDGRRPVGRRAEAGDRQRVAVRVPIVAQHVHRHGRGGVRHADIVGHRRLVGEVNGHRRRAGAALAVGDGVAEAVHRRRRAAVGRVGDRVGSVDRRRPASRRADGGHGRRVAVRIVVILEHVDRHRRRRMRNARVHRHRRQVGQEHAHGGGRCPALAVRDGVTERVFGRRRAGVGRVGDGVVTVDNRRAVGRRADRRDREAVAVGIVIGRQHARRDRGRRVR